MKGFVRSGKYTVKTYEAIGFKLIESLYPAQLRMPNHIHESASFCLVLQGTYNEKYERKSQLCKPSTVTIYPTGQEHAVDFEDAQVHTLDVVMSYERYKQICQYSTVMDCPKSLLNSETNYLINRLYREFNRRDEVSLLAVEGIILEILAESSRNGNAVKNISRGFPHWIKNVDEYLHEHFSESLTLEEIADIAGVHSVHLTRVFRERYKCTIGEYVRRLRIEFACQQISTSNTPLSEIALSLGFADQSHFARTFKAQLGVTPTEYRNISH